MITCRTTKAGVIRRDIEVNEANAAGESLCHVTETKGAVVIDTLYWLRRIPSDWGKAFQVEKGENGECYDILLDGLRGSSCSCKHGTYRPNAAPCRHVELVCQAIAEQKI
jgi:hypothetical protein